MRKILVIILFLTGLVMPKGVFAATLSLSPTSLTQAVGSTFNVDVVLDPKTDSVSAASVIVDYDATKLTALAVTQGALFSSAPLTNTIDTTKGEIRYDSGSLTSAITTRGVMATIQFRSIAAGSANATILFDPTVTTGTSLVAAASGPTNLLTGVDNGIYTITGTGTVTNTPLPATGAVENTIAIFAGGVIFLSSGIFLARRYFYA